MIGQTVMCRRSRQAFELPPDHVGDVVKCPFCSDEHPAPPIIPPPLQRIPVLREPPPVAWRVMRATAFALTLACGVALGMIAGLAIAAATMPTAEQFKATIASQRAELGEAQRGLAASRAEAAALAAEIDALELDLASAHEEIARVKRLCDDERKLADDNFAAYKKARQQLDVLRNSRRYR